MERLLSCLILLVLTVSAGANDVHWAFQSLDRPATGNGVDDFIEGQLKQRGLSISEREQPARLLRRIHLVLNGLPPSAEETLSFSAEPSEEHFADIVTDLLNRPQFGERWGRHWLDLARYADSNGLHEDSDRPHAWRYRDYVIQSFNDDKTYSQFIREQLAGNEIAPNDPDAWIATGFCRAGPSNEQNIAANELEAYRLDQIDNIIATTSIAFLGQTIACARCHDHKTEPFSLSDYYQLVDVFQNTVPAYRDFNNRQLGKIIHTPSKARNKYKPPKGDHLRALANSDQAVQTRALLRGNPATPGVKVSAGVPAVFTPFEAEFDNSEKPRTALANWIASPGNPLTWRVLANRVWQNLFGKGMVDTPGNLGVTGSEPTHPKLLDWLACELRDNGGHVKPVIRKIVLSKTFQQSSKWNTDAKTIDPDNRWLSCFPIRRLEAEVIRDSILAVSDNLNLEMGGPGIKPRIPEEIIEQSKRNTWPVVKKENKSHWRRSVYIYIKRQLPMPLMTLFDSPETTQSCAKRFCSTTPTQSLALFNDEFVNEQARYLAKRSLKEEDPVRYLLEKTLCVPATHEQLADARAFVKSQQIARSNREEIETDKMALADLAVVLFNSSQFVYLD